ncbi:MAG: type II secretion system protein [Candidatus Staskawiczbacteria bacterium]|nr:type II secretion system protein [Candidatus Staskawiczbacteria bacterium]
MNKGFTLIELVVVIMIIAILSVIIMFGVSQYIGKGKDSNISGNLAVLVPAGEVYYNGNGNSYAGLCDPTQTTGSVLKNSLLQMPDQARNSGAPCYNETATTSDANPKGVCCKVEPNYGQSWVACARKFTDSKYAFCVDSRGVKEDICSSYCATNIPSLLTPQCPDPSTQTNCT